MPVITSVVGVSAYVPYIELLTGKGYVVDAIGDSGAHLRAADRANCYSRGRSGSSCLVVIILIVEVVFHAGGAESLAGTEATLQTFSSRGDNTVNGMAVEIVKRGCYVFGLRFSIESLKAIHNAGGNGCYRLTADLNVNGVFFGKERSSNVLAASIVNRTVNRFILYTDLNGAFEVKVNLSALDNFRVKNCNLRCLSLAKNAGQYGYRVGISGVDTLILNDLVCNLILTCEIIGCICTVVEERLYSTVISSVSAIIQYLYAVFNNRSLVHRRLDESLAVGVVRGNGYVNAHFCRGKLYRGNHHRLIVNGYSLEVNVISFADACVINLNLSLGNAVRNVLIIEVEVNLAVSCNVYTVQRRIRLCQNDQNCSRCYDQRDRNSRNDHSGLSENRFRFHDFLLFENVFETLIVIKFFRLALGHRVRPFELRLL